MYTYAEDVCATGRDGKRGAIGRSVSHSRDAHAGSAAKYVFDSSLFVEKTQLTRPKMQPLPGKEVEPATKALHIAAGGRGAYLFLDKLQLLRVGGLDSRCHCPGPVMRAVEKTCDKNMRVS